MRGRGCQYCRRVAVWAAGTVFLACTATVGAQTTATPPLTSREIVAVQATKPPVIDGEMAEPGFKAAVDELGKHSTSKATQD